MSLSKARATIAIALLCTPLALLAAACSRGPEQQFLNQFFRASRSRDTTTLAMMSAVDFDPREQGEITDFEIANVSEERRTPLDFQSLMAAERKAVADEADFRKRKLEYQNANLPALEVIVKLERDPAAKMTAAQQKMKAEWDKWRADTNTFQKATAAAKAAVKTQSGPAEASLAQPGQPPFNPDKFQGDLISKDVTINAQVSQNGQVTPKTFVITIQRVAGTMDGAQREGRSIITRIQGA